MDVRRATTRRLAFAAFILLAGGAWTLSVRAEEPAAAAAPEASTAPADAEDLYVYNGAARDPFVPLSGSSAGIDYGASGGDNEPGAFNPQGIELKGIIRMPTGRWAILTSSAGDRYVVENGKILDPRRKPVEGYVGIIKEKSLVIIGPNNQVTEMKMKRDLEEEEKQKAKAPKQ